MIDDDTYQNLVGILSEMENCKTKSIDFMEI